MRRTSADSCGAGRGLPGSLGLGSTGLLSPGEVAGSACPSPVLPAGAQGACTQPPGQPRTLLSSTHPCRRVPRRPTPAGLGLEIALTSLPCPPLPVGPGAPSLHPRLPCPVRNRPARSSREAASSAEWSHVVARAPRTGSGAHARARVVRGRMGGGGIEVGVPMGMHRGMDCWEDGEMNRINGRWVDVWRCGATVGWRRVGGRMGGGRV